MFNDNNRGQVGIGTLIVFIAMVLVAAIAAGVLINTAGLLQSQAEATGEESSAQVSDRVQVSTVTGTTGSDTEESDNFNELENERVDRISLTVLRSPGADDIDLTNAIIEVFANGESATLTHSDNQDPDFESDDIPDPDSEETGSGTIGQDDFKIVSIQNADDGSLSDTSDRAQLVFDLSDIEAGEDGATLGTGDTVEISVTTASGATAFVEKRAPSSLEDSETYRL